MPAGTPQPADAPTVTPLSVSMATPALLSEDIYAEDQHAWWKLSMPEAGQLSIDVLLSFTNTGEAWTVDTWLDVYPADDLSSFADDALNQGPVELDAGDYLIRVYPADDVDPGVVPLFVLRVGEIGLPVTDWVQPDDIVYTASAADNLVPGDANPFVTTSTSKDRWDSGGLWVNLNNFEGYYIMQQALLGPFPGNDPDTFSPMWKNARIGQAGVQAWKEEPLDSGTWMGGPGHPVDHSGEDLQGGADEPGPTVGPEPGRVHIKYQSDEGSIGVPAFEEEHTHAFANRMHLKQMLTDFGPLMGVGLDPADDGVEDPQDVEFEDTVGEIIEMEAQPDEAGDAGTYTLTTNWYLLAVPQMDGDAEWGPSSGDNDLGDFIGRPGWQGGVDGPEGFAGKQDQAITGFVGSSLGWATIDSAIWEAALSFEAADVHHIGGLRAVALPAELLTDSIPSQASPSAAPEVLDAYRDFQALAVRLTLRPPRHRWLLDPAIPDVETLDTVITGALTGPRVRFFRQ